MDDLGKVFLVVGLTVLVVVVFNYGIIKTYTGKSGGVAKMFTGSVRSAKKTWDDGEDQLDELSQLMKTVKEQSAQKDQTDE